MKEDSGRPQIETLLERLDSQDREIQRLRALVEDEGGSGVAHNGPGRSRRDLLKLAGAAVVGAAGAVAPRAVPAAAANGDTITVGGTFTGTVPTTLTNIDVYGIPMAGRKEDFRS